MNQIVMQYPETGQIDHFQENVIGELIPIRFHMGNIGTNATLIGHI